MNERKIKYPKFVDAENIKVENYGYDDEKFRFLLIVPFKSSGNKFLRVIMKNPSVANEQKCDMTLRKVCNATYKAGCDGVVIMNLFPFRAKYASDVYENFYNADKELYESAMAINKQIIKNTCTDSYVVFAWGTNTIRKINSFDVIYDKIANDIIDVISSCSIAACAPCLDKHGKHPIHGLRWWNEILIEGGKVFENDTSEEAEKHPVLHRNMFGPTAEVCNTNSEDLEIYCYRKNEICKPECEGCKYFRGDEEGLGRDCEWNDFDGNLSDDERVIQNYEKFLEYDRVQYAKKSFYNKDVEEYAVQHRDAYREFERVDKLIKEEEDMEYPLPGVEVYFAMSEEQAKKLNKPVCIQPNLPKSKDVYFAMRKVPDELCEEKVIGWERIIKFKRQNVYKVMEYLYPDGCDFDINKYLTQIDGDFVWIIGFGD